MNYIFHEDILVVLKKTGWFPGRDISFKISEISQKIETASGIKIFSAAFLILKEFGNLTFNIDKPGVDLFASSFSFFPEDCIGELERLLFYQGFCNTNLYPIGREKKCDSFLAIGENCKIYNFLDTDFVIEIGESFENSLFNLIKGVKGKTIYIDEANF
jgi:hypothetical protein